ncbi:MAG: DUF3883 domain-containing protein [Rhodopseudomonas palustris]|uniref:DUF3883 domain-containing protein n=1 Tax=Rhodopseudomonas palustris TaxID=1076 RepID=A0A933W0S0_RHOPL|nr:DUF3883 domain-containing protein [Rhodopseudomonas palustris]
MGEAAMRQNPILFVNVGWMVNYRGPADDDPTLGGHGYLKTHKIGYEAWNFMPYRGVMYGYIPGSRQVNLRTLGSSASFASLQGVTVVWIARSPQNGITYIVGWYLSATVHAKENPISLKRGNIQISYWIETDPANAILLPVERRLFIVPTEKKVGNLGQSPIWYGGTDQFRERVRKYIVSGRPGVSKERGSPKQNDAEARKKIELAAVRHAVHFYRSEEGGGRNVRSVEKDGVGWDLTVTDVNGHCLLVEVKGLSGRQVAVELTPNEYQKMRSTEHRESYVIYVVSEAGTSGEKSHVFYYDRESSCGGDLVWRASDGRKLKIDERLAARLSCI